VAQNKTGEDQSSMVEKRAADARAGAPGVSWDELKRDLLK
jgi:hypothetical protein